MCVIDRKTYVHPDGARETIETARRCRHARGSGFCKSVEVRESGSANLVEKTPRTTSQNLSDGTILTETYGGRQHVYRDVTAGLMRRSSQRSSRRVATTTSSPSSRGSPASAVVAIVEVKPAAPMPPPAVPSSKSRASFEVETTAVESSGGAAFYNSPSALELPKAFHNERLPRRSASIDSFPSTSATVDEPVYEPSSPASRFGVSSSSAVRGGHTKPNGSPSSPGLSELPEIGPRRSKHDSAKYFESGNGRGNDNRPRAETLESGRRREQAQADADVARLAQQEEDERQASIERARMAAYDRRQNERLADAERSSRERHREEAAASLEGNMRQNTQQQANSEFAQMARERREAEQRRRSSQQNPPRPSPKMSRRPTLDDQPYNSPLRSPVSARGSMSLTARSPISPPMVHNNYPPPIDPTLRPSTINERGAEVIARERAHVSRGAPRSPIERGGPQYQARRLEDAVQRMTFDEDFVLYDDEETYEEVEPQSPRDRRGGDRERRPRDRRGDYHS